MMLTQHSSHNIPQSFAPPLGGTFLLLTTSAEQWNFSKFRLALHVGLWWWHSGWGLEGVGAAYSLALSLRAGPEIGRSKAGLDAT